MDPVNPLPLWYALLTPALAGVWLAGRGLATMVSRDVALRPWLGSGLAVAMWLTAMHSVAILAGSFRVGLWVGTLGVASAGAWWWWRRRGVQQLQGEGAEAGGWRPRTVLLAAVLAAAVISPLALGWGFHDEGFYLGHLSMTAQVQNDVYPLRHPTFPDRPLRYHAGFALSCATVSALFRLPLNDAIDLVTLTAFAWTFALLWILGVRLMGRRGALTPVIFLFGAGWAIPGFGDSPPLLTLLGVHFVENTITHPPVVSYFFQHPWSLGLPLAVTTLLLLAERGPAKPARYAAYGLLLVTIAFTQVVLFASFCGVLLVAEGWHQGKVDLRRVIGAVAAVAVSLLLAVEVPLSWFFLPGYGGEGAVGMRFGFASPWGVLVWHFLSFAFLLPLGLVGLLVRRVGLRERLAFGLLAAGGFVSYFFFYYTLSWDIFKFAVVTSLGLSIGATASLAVGLGSKRMLVRAAARVGVLMCVFGSLSFVFAFTVNLPGIAAVLRESPLPAPDDAAAISWLRTRAEPEEMVWRSEIEGAAYARYGGLPVPWTDVMTPRYGFPESDLAARADLLRSKPDTAERYRLEGVRWFVYSAVDVADALLAARCRRWIASGEAVEASRFGDLRVVRLNGELRRTQPPAR